MDDYMILVVEFYNIKLNNNMEDASNSWYFVLKYKLLIF